MYFLDTEMRMVTFVIVALEVLLFFHQLIYYLFRPQDKLRFWFLILLLLLIFYNVTGGLFPDPQYDMSIRLQNIIAYGSGFLMASYFPYYFYRAFELKKLRFHAIYGVPLFLLFPYLVFLVFVYSIDQDLSFAVRHSIVVPFFYSLVLLWAILRAIRHKYKDNSGIGNYPEVIAMYCAVAPWAAMTVMAYFQVDQIVEVIVTNAGFLVIAIIFIYRSVERARKEYQELTSRVLIDLYSDVFEETCAWYQLTTREIEILRLICQGMKYREIGDRLFISERTVTTHVQHIFQKVGVNSRIELLHRVDLLPGA